MYPVIKTFYVQNNTACLHFLQKHFPKVKMQYHVSLSYSPMKPLGSRFSVLSTHPMMSCKAEFIFFYFFDVCRSWNKNYSPCWTNQKQKKMINGMNNFGCTLTYTFTLKRKPLATNHNTSHT